MTDTPTPFFGIGAMRSGTTWLSELLESHPDCAVMPFKEMHFFDLRYGYGGIKYFRSKARRMASNSKKVAKRMEAALEQMGETASDEQDASELEMDPAPVPRSIAWTDEVRRDFFARAQVDDALRHFGKVVDVLSIRDLESYGAYLKNHGAGAAAFGEITPAYGVLPAAAFAEMDGLFPGARFIFVMRDPTDRLWSHVRHRTDRAKRRERNALDPNQNFRKMIQLQGAILRSTYQHTIEELESVVPKDRIIYLFYESMVSPEFGPGEVRRLESSLGLKPLDIDPKFFASTVNSSRPADMDPENEKAALEVFAPVYAFVERRFGQPWGWRSLDASA